MEPPLPIYGGPRIGRDGFRLALPEGAIPLQLPQRDSAVEVGPVSTVVLANDDGEQQLNEVPALRRRPAGARGRRGRRLGLRRRRRRGQRKNKNALQQQQQVVVNEVSVDEVEVSEK